MEENTEIMQETTPEVVETSVEDTPEIVEQTTVQTPEETIQDSSTNTEGDSSGISESIEETTEELTKETIEETPIDAIPNDSIYQIGSYYYDGCECFKSSQYHYWYYRENDERVVIPDIENIVLIGENGEHIAGVATPDYLYLGKPCFLSSSGYWYYFDGNGERVTITDEENIVSFGENAEEPTEEPEEETEVECYTEVPFLEKPLDEYTTSEGLLLLIFLLGIVAFVWHLMED